jgi:hypothetical protein
MGSFADAYEGADIYICGYPLGINKSLVHFGVLSTKATISFSASGNYFFPKLDGTKTEIAWLDITLNRGNSGGPVILMGKKPKDDRVIGIISVSIKPLPPDLIELIETLNRQKYQSSPIDSLLNPSRGSKGLSDEDMRKFINLVGQGLLNSSLGFGACVSIDNLKNRLIQK